MSLTVQFNNGSDRYLGIQLSSVKESEAWKAYREKLTGAGDTVNVFDVDKNPITITFDAIDVISSAEGDYAVLKIAAASVGNALDHEGQLKTINPFVRQTGNNTYETFLAVKASESLSSDGNIPMNTVYRTLETLSKFS